MKVYLIDYENVNEAGIKGIKDLTAEDQVHIFYSDRIKTIPFERSIDMVESKAKIEFFQIHKLGKNYLDFQLSMHLGYLFGKGINASYFVVSKDTGFDSIVDFGKSRNMDISRCESIEDSQKENIIVKHVNAIVDKPRVLQKVKRDELPEAIRKKIRLAVKADQLLPSGYSAIYRAMVESKDKVALNNFLVKVFKGPKGGQVYGHIKEIFEGYKMTN